MAFLGVVIGTIIFLGFLGFLYGVYTYIKSID